MSRDQARVLSRQSDIISMALRMDDLELLDLAFGFVRGCYNQQIKKDIISNIAEDSHLSKKDITEVVDLALTQIFEGLSEGKTVDLAGFGKFEITERKAREGFNPLTKEKIQIEASKSVKFKVAKALKEAVNK